jgi:hypothetical protein
LDEDLELIEEIIDKLELDFNTTAEYEIELRTNSRYTHELDRVYKEAMKEVNIKKLELEIVAAEVLDTIIKDYEKKKGKDFPLSAMQEVRKSQVPLDKRYVEAKQNLNDAVNTMEVLGGLRQAWSDRGYKLKQLGKFVEDSLTHDKKNIRPTEKRLNKVGNKLELGDELYG